MRAGERSGAKFLIVCSTPLSKSEMSLEVIGAVAPLARVATTFRALEASVVGWARRPAWANSVPAKHAAHSEKTRARHPASDRLILIFRVLPCMVAQSQRWLIRFCFLFSSLCWLGFFGCRRQLWRRRFLFRFFGATALARVVGHIPTFAFELDRGPGKLLFQTTPALAAPRGRLVRQFLKNLEMGIALLTAKFVNRHYKLSFVNLFPVRVGLYETAFRSDNCTV